MEATCKDCVFWKRDTESERGTSELGMCYALPSQICVEEDGPYSLVPLEHSGRPACWYFKPVN